MNTPVTKLDQRYSGAAAVATTWDETRQALEDAELFWVSTVRADGRPHVTPVVGAWCDGAMWFTTGTEEQKYLNLTRQSAGGADHRLQQLGPRAGRGGGGRGPSRHRRGRAQRAAKAFAVKWQGAWQFAVRDGRFYNGGSEDWPCEVFSVTPARVFAHKKGEPFGATTHRF